MMTNRKAFVLVKGGPTGTVIAVSEPLGFVNYNEPLQIHLALTSSPTEMNVMWNTLNSSNPTVQWGTVSGNYTWRAPAVTHTYTSNDVCGEPAKTYAWINPGLFHEAVMTNLTVLHTSSPLPRKIYPFFCRLV